LHPQQFWCTPKNEGKGYMYPQMKKPVGMINTSITSVEAQLVTKISS
jgi:hypothetical protein